MSTPEPGFAPDRIGVAVVDADPLAREGLRAIIAAEDNLSLLQETAQVNSILAQRVARQAGRHLRRSGPRQ